MNTNKKRVLSGFLALWLMGNLSYDHKLSSNYEIRIEEEYFANYSKGKVYIGNKEFIDNLTDIKDNDILIIDNRDGEDPNIRILSSYKITDSNVRDEILEILLEYESIYPSSWERSFDSMRVEWLIHNMLYYLNYQKNRTQDVDFNNKDEKTYQKRKLLKKIIIP